MKRIKYIKVSYYKEYPQDILGHQIKKFTFK